MRELRTILAELNVLTCGAAATEEDAVEKALMYRPDLVVADVELREGSGICAVRRIAAAHPVRIVFVTDQWTTVDQSVGSSPSVKKPFDIRAVEEAIQTAFGLPTECVGGPAR